MTWSELIIVIYAAQAALVFWLVARRGTIGRWIRKRIFGEEMR